LKDLKVSNNLKAQNKLPMQTIKAVVSLTAFLTKTGNRSQTAGSLAINVVQIAARG